MIFRTIQRLSLAVVLLLTPSLAHAQATGRLIGRVVDADGSTPIAGARVDVVGTDRRATTAVDGRYSLSNIPVGTISVRVSMVGFQPKIVTEIVIRDGGVTEQPIKLTAAAVQLADLTVTGTVERGSVAGAIDEQRNSTGIVNAISAEQIARSPDGDAAAAMQRVSGISVQDNRYMIARGLGDRYVAASYNGARIPSPEPERKVVPLDLFPSALLSGIVTSKTFTPDQPGDFTGASVNIRTRDFPGQRYFALSTSGGFNDAVTGKDAMFAPSVSGDWLAMGSSDRALPSQFGTTDFSQNLTSSEANSLISSLRNVWSARPGTGTPNGSFGASLGGNIATGGTGISYLLSGTYATAQETKTDQRRALAATVSSGVAEEVDRYEGSTGRATVLWGGIANASTTLGSHTKISLNNTYNRTMDNEGRREIGYSENLATPLMIQRLRYVERNVFSSQLSMHHEVGVRHGIDWGVTVSGVSRKEPDRSEIVYTLANGTPEWYGFSNEAAVRTFANLQENAFEGHADWQMALGDPSSGRAFRVGALYREAHREARNQVFSIALARSLPSEALAADPETIFGEHTQDGDDYLRITPLSTGGSYTATDRQTAVYAMMVFPIGNRLEFTGGARVENSRVEVLSLSTAGEPSTANPEYTDLLPALGLTWRFSDNVNLRFSATQTLSRPEYRELSPILFREVIGAENVKGNPDLKRALIQNYDVRWEWYPNQGEVLSIGFFAKQFNNPIERVYQGTSGTRIISYVNALGANNYGIELEARKSLGMLGNMLRPFTAFANVTVMESQIELDPSAGSITSGERGMVGQSPYVVNAGLTWAHPRSEASATVLFNRVGARITEAGELPLPDVVEQARSVVDFSLRLPLFSTLSAKFDARNLLDADYRLTQGDVVRESYRAGRVFSLGFTWSQ